MLAYNSPRSWTSAKVFKAKARAKEVIARTTHAVVSLNP
jgi:hypothetical protein